MENLFNVKKSDILPEFQTFLLEKKLAPEKNVFFYALWVSKYFTYARKKLSSDQGRRMADVQTRRMETYVETYGRRRMGRP